MLEIIQMQLELNNLVRSHKLAKEEFKDPYYIAWKVHDIIQKENWPEHKDIVKARGNKNFRIFWNSFKKCNEMVKLFQVIPMGIIPFSARETYIERLKWEHPKEVPF